MCGIALALISREDSVSDVLAQLEPNVRRRGPDAFEITVVELPENRKLVFVSAVLQMQGSEARRPSLRDNGDKRERILLYNGEVYEGLPGMGPDTNDGEALLKALGGGRVADVMSRLRGPWAFVYYEDGILWWGRDVMGRKSLLMIGEGPRMMLTSVAPVASTAQAPLPCAEVAPGLYRASLGHLFGGYVDAVVRVGWEDDLLLDLSQYNRPNVDDDHLGQGDRDPYGHDEGAAGIFFLQSAGALLDLLTGAVRRRCATAAYVPAEQDFRFERDARFMVLFSGGVDSTLIAALIHKVLPAREPIELCSICFAMDGTSPDRLGALDAYRELKTQFPDRQWRFIAVNRTYEELNSRKERLLALLRPKDSVMDFNIGGALWLATAGAGSLVDVCPPSSPSADSVSVAVVEETYVSKARVVFLGHGADELFGGYGRHRTRFVKAGWQALADELQLDVRRIWERNFGRDDRVVSDHGKEGRLPFMDERVIAFALTSPLRNLMDFSLPPGEGDKRILRECLRLLGLEQASQRVKRAMQFGTRLAKASNEALFGSNTQANRRHAGGRAKVQV